jgi:C-terminal processing protease CtpA/Prc
MKKIFIYLQILLLHSCAIAKLDVNQAKEDVTFLVKQLNEIHPEVYSNCNKDSFNLQLETCIKAIEKRQVIDQKSFYCLLNPLVTSIKDGHTRIEPPNNVMLRSFFWGSRVIPLQLQFNGNSLVVENCLVKRNSIPAGASVLSINGISTNDIVKQLQVNKYGENIEFRNSFVNSKTIPRDLWMFLNMNRSFRVEYLDTNNEIKNVDLKGVSQPYYYRKMTTERNVLGLPIFFEQENAFFIPMDKDSAGYIRYEACFGYSDSTFFRNVFEYANSHSLNNLILDLRNNGGGSTSVYSVLLQHLTETNIIPFSKIEYKFSKQVLERKPFGEGFPYPNQEAIGSIHVLDKSSYLIQSGNSETYKGKLFCLCNAGTFSTASSLVAILKDNNLATIVGQPTGGNGTSYGNFIRVELPHSKITLLVSMAKYYRGNEDEAKIPVEPDIYIDFNTLTDKELIYSIIK